MTTLHSATQARVFYHNLEIYKRKDVNNEMAREVDTKGYVKLYRKAQEDEIFKNPYAWQLFTYCLFNATFDSRYGEVGR